jgi:carbamoyltransferase
MSLFPQATHRMVFRHDPHFGHRYVANLNARIPNELGGFYIRTNAQGFRSETDFVREANGRRRILFFGDSFTAGDLCDNRERFSDLLGEWFDAEVYNYGLSSTGTDQQLLVFEHEAKQVEGDLIVLAVFVENIERNQVSHRVTVERETGKRILVPKPYFTLEHGRLVLHQVPVPLERPEASPEREGSDRFGSHRRDPRLRLLYAAIDHYRSDPRMRRARQALAPVLDELRGPALRAARFHPFPDYASADSEGWLLMKAILERFLSQARCPVLLVPLPTYHYYRDGLPPDFQERFATLHAPDRVYVADVARPICALPRADRRRLSFEQDVHFSPEGHRVMADLIAKEIEKHGLMRRALPAPIDLRTEARARRKPRPTFILGISCFYHNSAVSLVRDGSIISAAEEERFTRVKNDRRFPYAAINYCLESAGIQASELAAIVIYESAPLTFERLMHTEALLGPRGEANWNRFMSSWALYKLHVPRLIREYLQYQGPILSDRHHRSHAASAYYPSPFDDAAILTIDGVGEWATASIGIGEGQRLRLLKEMRFPDSLGLLYSAFTQFTGFKVNSGEYKMMGLAPYGEPKYVDRIFEHLVDLKEDGSLELNLEYFGFLDRPSMTSEKFAELFGGPARKSEEWITQREMDLARSVQAVTEEAMLRMARHVRSLTGKSKLCLAGGVALNCVANGRILREGPFEHIWIQPAAGDAGGALGCALDAYHTYFGAAREPPDRARPMQAGSLWGPEFSQAEIEAFLESNGYPFHRLNREERAPLLAKLLEEGRVVGHFAGRAELGPRALGARSIIGDPRNPEMQVNLNLKIKYRESFRPFAPSVLEEKAGEYFDLKGPSPYMLLVAPVKEARRLPVERRPGESLLEIVKRRRSDIPAITHVDYSARVQTVNREVNPEYHAVISEFEKRTGCAVIVNTSFNVRGEPIVLTPFDAYRCFMGTEMDVLVLEDAVLYKAEQPGWGEAKGHLEHDAPEPDRPDEKVANKLQRIFTMRFLPFATRMAARGDLKINPRFRRGASSWVDVEEPEDARELFHIPVALGALGPPSPAAMAEALVAEWDSPAAARELKEILEEILETAESHRAKGELKEEVSDSVYVMF